MKIEKLTFTCLLFDMSLACMRSSESLRQTAEPQLTVNMTSASYLGSDAYMQTLKALKKNFWRVGFHKNPAEILLLHNIARPYRNVKTCEEIHWIFHWKHGRLAR